MSPEGRQFKSGLRPSWPANGKVCQPSIKWVPVSNQGMNVSLPLQKRKTVVAGTLLTWYGRRKDAVQPFLVHTRFVLHVRQ